MIRVEVTQADIDEGCPGDMDCCPIARALERASAPFFDGSFGSGRVFQGGFNCDTLYLECGHLVIEAPAEVRVFVEMFDGWDGESPRSEECQPFSFELPDFNSGEWGEQCKECNLVYSLGELDDDSVCDDCAEET